MGLVNTATASSDQSTRCSTCTPRRSTRPACARSAPGRRPAGCAWPPPPGRCSALHRRRRRCRARRPRVAVGYRRPPDHVAARSSTGRDDPPLIRRDAAARPPSAATATPMSRPMKRPAFGDPAHPASSGPAGHGAGDAARARPSAAVRRRRRSPAERRLNPTARHDQPRDHVSTRGSAGGVPHACPTHVRWALRCAGS